MKFAVIGCGRMGRRRANAIIQNPEAELVCVADADNLHGKAVAKQLGCGFTSKYELAVNKNDVDVVVISTPNKFHMEDAIYAMEYGKDVFCEKPLARTPKEAQFMIDKAEETGRMLKVSSNIRYFANLIKAKKIVDNKSIGDIIFLRGWIGHGGWNLTPESWFTDPDMIGGGTLIDNGCHLIDLVRWYFGEVVECIGYKTSLRHTLLKGLEDNAMAILLTEDGKPMFIQSSWTEWNPYLYIELYGTKGSVIIDSRGAAATTTIKLPEFDQVFDYSREPRESFKREIDDFIKYRKQGQVLPPTGYDGLRVLEIIFGIYQSAREGKMIKIPEG